MTNYPSSETGLADHVAEYRLHDGTHQKRTRLVGGSDWSMWIAFDPAAPGCLCPGCSPALDTHLRLNPPEEVKFRVRLAQAEAASDLAGRTERELRAKVKALEADNRSAARTLSHTATMLLARIPRESSATRAPSLLSRIAAVKAIAEETDSEDGDEMEALTPSMVFNLCTDVTARIEELRAALNEALDAWATADEDRQTGLPTLENPRIVELRKLTEEA